MLSGRESGVGEAREGWGGGGVIRWVGWKGKEGGGAGWVGRRGELEGKEGGEEEYKDWTGVDWMMAVMNLMDYEAAWNFFMLSQSVSQSVSQSAAVTNE